VDLAARRAQPCLFSLACRTGLLNRSGSVSHQTRKSVSLSKRMAWVASPFPGRGRLSSTQIPQTFSKRRNAAAPSSLQAAGSGAFWRLAIRRRRSWSRRPKSISTIAEKIRDADCCRRQRNNTFRSRSIEMKIAMQTDLGAIPDFMGIDVRFPGIDGGRSGLFRCSQFIRMHRDRGSSASKQIGWKEMIAR